MIGSISTSSRLTLAISVALVATGVAFHSARTSSVAILPALVLTAIGLAGVTSVLADRSPQHLSVTTRRAWLLAIGTFVPFGLATAPSNERAAAMGDLLSGPLVGLATETIAGTAILCAVAITVVYGLARYGIHPGRPTPEERILNDD